MEAQKLIEEAAGPDDQNSEEEELKSIKDKYEELLKKHEDLQEKHNDLSAKHDEDLVKKHEVLVEENNSLRDDYKNLVEKHEQLVQKHDGLVQQLRDKIECPVCLDVPKKAPIPVCPNGHVVCSKCVKEECPTCRVMMEHGKSTLAVTVMENIDHECENEGCQERFPFAELARHGKCCMYRPVQCPGFKCDKKMSLNSLPTHLMSCCFRETGNIESVEMPRVVIYSFPKEKLREDRDTTWKILPMKFDERIFVLKVARCKINGNDRRWVFMVQMFGGEEALNYTTSIIVHKPDDNPEETFSQRYYGAICPIDVVSVEDADVQGLCLSLTDGAMTKFVVDIDPNVNNGSNNKFAVAVYIYNK